MINWKVRFKNKVWLATFASLIIGFAFNVLAMFDIYPKVTQNAIVEAVSQILTLLGLLGIIVDPTTAGVGDSQRALGYEEPWRDEPPEGE